MRCRFHGQQEPRVCNEVGLKHVAIVRRILGWLRKERQVGLDELSVKLFFKDSSASSIELSLQHLAWLRTERHASFGHEVHHARTLMQASPPPLAW